MDIKEQVSYYDVKNYYPLFNINSEDGHYLNAHLTSVSIIKDYQNNTNYTGKKTLQERLLASLIKHGTRKNFEVQIQSDDILFTRYCPMTGLEIDYYGSFHKNKAPTLTKKDFSKGYVPGNVQVVCLMAKNYVIKRGNDGPAIVTIIKNRYKNPDNPQQYAFKVDYSEQVDTKEIIKETQLGSIRKERLRQLHSVSQNISNRNTKKKLNMFVMIERLTEQIPQTIERLQELGELNSEVVTELYNTINQ